MTSSSPLRVEARNLTAAAAREAGEPRNSDELIPGDVIEYTLTLTNTTQDSIRDVQFVDPVPQGLVYELESASADRADVLVEFSIDGGESWTSAPMITQTIDGEVQTRPAPAEAYTHVRWTVGGWIRAGDEVVAQFRAHHPDPTLSGDRP